MKEHMIKIGLSTSSVYPLGLEETFRYAKNAGYDGVEIMVSQNSDTRNPDALNALAEKYGMPVLSIHAPVLLLTHFVWGKDPEVKLWKSAELAQKTGASTVVVHPPFTWQNEYSKNFLSIVKRISESTGIEIAVENMFSWKYKAREVQAYSPTWDQITQEAEALTIDFSHAALSGLNSYDAVQALGDKIRHIHLCDGTGKVENEKDKIFDEHLIPGAGNQPVAETLQLLASRNWNGHVVAEVNTRKIRKAEERLRILAETAEFARKNLRGASHS